MSSPSASRAAGRPAPPATGPAGGSRRGPGRGQTSRAGPRDGPGRRCGPRLGGGGCARPAGRIRPARCRTGRSGAGRTAPAGSGLARFRTGRIRAGRLGAGRLRAWPAQNGPHRAGRTIRVGWSRRLDRGRTPDAMACRRSPSPVEARTGPPAWRAPADGWVTAAASIVCCRAPGVGVVAGGRVVPGLAGIIRPVVLVDSSPARSGAPG